MVKHARDYKWSSYRFNAEGKKNQMLTPHEQYMSMDSQTLSRRKAYRELFRSQENVDTEDQIRSATNGNYVLGNKGFQEQIALALGRRVTKGKAGRPKGSEVME